MTVDEALQEIEAAPGASPDEIRRAYLRKLKTRHPATDPEGFRRLREAFELLQPLGLSAEGILDSRSAALWQIAQEISWLPSGFPQAVRAAIAQAVHDDTLETALPILQSTVKEDPDAGWRMASDLKELPALRSLYHGAVLAALPARTGHEPVISQSRRPVTRDPREIRRAMVILFAAAAVLGVLYFLFAPPPLAVPLSPALEDTVQAICRHGAEVPTTAEAELCRAARSLAVRLEQRRCSRTVSDAMLEAHQKVRAQPARTAGASAREVDAAVLDLFFEYSKLCR
jgi:hypothetical protein